MGIPTTGSWKPTDPPKRGRFPTDSTEVTRGTVLCPSAIQVIWPDWLLRSFRSAAFFGVAQKRMRMSALSWEQCSLVCDTLQLSIWLTYHGNSMILQTLRFEWGLATLRHIWFDHNLRNRLSISMSFLFPCRADVESNSHQSQGGVRFVMKSVCLVEMASFDRKSWIFYAFLGSENSPPQKPSISELPGPCDGRSLRRPLESWSGTLWRSGGPKK